MNDLKALTEQRDFLDRLQRSWARRGNGEQQALTLRELKSVDAAIAKLTQEIK